MIITASAYIKFVVVYWFSCERKGQQTSLFYCGLMDFVLKKAVFWWFGAAAPVIEKWTVE